MNFDEKDPFWLQRGLKPGRHAARSVGHASIAEFKFTVSSRRVRESMGDLAVAMVPSEGQQGRKGNTTESRKDEIRSGKLC